MFGYVLVESQVRLLISVEFIVREAASSGKFNITPELVRTLGLVPHPICAILRSFQIFYFSIDLLMTLSSVLLFSCGGCTE